jgi:hypothetical protein
MGAGKAANAPAPGKTEPTSLSPTHSARALATQPAGASATQQARPSAAPSASPSATPTHRPNAGVLAPLSGLPPWLVDVLLAAGLLAAGAYATEPVAVLVRRRRSRGR